MEEKRYCTLCKKEEERNECSYGPEAWDMATLSPKLFVKNEQMSPAELMLQKQQLRLNTMKLMQQRQDLQKKKSISSPMNPGSLEDTVKKESVERINKLGKYYTISFVFRGLGKVIQFFVADVKRPTREDIAKQLEKVYPGARLVNYYESLRQPQEALIYVDINEQLKPHKSVEEIAKKHRLEVSFIQKQLDIGVPIEHEHTKDKNLATDIALQHLDEIPDYYTRLKKMEADAKKHHKKFNDMKEDWQSVNRKDKTDGLSPAAVKAYRRENPGSKLQTAVTEKNPEGKRAKRRKSFCSRMKGMKKRLTSAETARDPDSRINKALRRWNCN